MVVLGLLTNINLETSHILVFEISDGLLSICVVVVLDECISDLNGIKEGVGFVNIGSTKGEQTNQRWSKWMEQIAMDG